MLIYLFPFNSAAAFAKAATGRTASAASVSRASDGALVAEVKHTVVVSDLVLLRSIDMPDDLRAELVRHLEPATT